MIPIKGLFYQQNANGEDEGGNNEELFAGGEEHEDEEREDRQEDGEGKELTPTGPVRGKEHMKRFDDEDEDGLNEVKVTIGLGEVEFVQEQEVDGGLDLGHERVEKMEVLPFQAGLENPVEHEDDNDLDDDIDGFGDDGTGIVSHDFLGFLSEPNGIPPIGLFDFFDLGGNGGLFFLGTVGGEA